MKKILLGCIALAIASQTVSAGTDITVKPRLEGAYNSMVNENEYDLGMSSLYTFLEGAFSENFSYYAQLHLLSRTPGDLYRYAADDESSMFINGTWLDMFYLTYERDFWGIDLGKVNLNFGGMSNEYDDVDIYSGFAPFNWYEFNTYQYGLTFRLMPWEGHSFEIQATTSPSMEDLDNLSWAYSLTWRGEMGNWSTAWTVNEFNDKFFTDNTHNYDIGLGNRYDFSDSWNVELDAYLHIFDEDIDDFNYSEINLTGCYNATESLSIKALAGLKGKKALSLGACIEYYPVEALRLHAVMNYCDGSELAYPCHLDNEKKFEANIGLTYTFDFHIGR